jgi:hypothetical protein
VNQNAWGKLLYPNGACNSNCVIPGNWRQKGNPGDLMGGYFATARPPCASFIFNVLEFTDGFASVFWKYVY